MAPVGFGSADGMPPHEAQDPIAMIARRVEERERTLAAGLGEPGDLIRRYREALPFALTPYQEEAIREIDSDLARTTPMQRLLQGDVGSGKTVVAIAAMLLVVEAGAHLLGAPAELVVRDLEPERARLLDGDPGAHTATGSSVSMKDETEKTALPGPGGP